MGDLYTLLLLVTLLLMGTGGLDRIANVIKARIKR